MTFILAALILVAQASPPFTAVSVAGRPGSPTTMQVDIGVSLTSGDGPVLAHLILPSEPETTHPLMDLGGRRWGTTIVLRRADWRVVFEDVPTGQLSEPASFTRLGLDASLLEPEEVPVPVPVVSAVPPWGWLSLASGALGVALLVWALAPSSVSPQHRRLRPPSRRSGRS
ncbi:MAG: hypothetical protein WB239_01485 [Acidimicrobiia bacterium]